MQKIISFSSIVLIFYVLPLICNAQTMTVGMADGHVEHSYSTSTSSSTTSKNSGSYYAAPSKEDILKNRVKSLTKSLEQLNSTRLKEIDAKTNQTSFNSPFKGKTAPTQQIVEDWEEKAELFEDKSSDNDYAKLSNEIDTDEGNRLFEEVGYFVTHETIPLDNTTISDLTESNPLSNSMDISYQMSSTTQNSFTKNDLSDSNGDQEENAGFYVVDKAMDEVLDHVEPELGSGLKSIKNIGYKTIDQFSAQFNNFWEGDFEKSEAMFNKYKSEISKEFAGILPGVSTVNEIIDLTKKGIDTSTSFLIKLFD